MTSELIAHLERERIAGIASELRDARQARGLTLQQVAVRIGVGRSTVCQWEKGHQVPDSYHLDAWARSLGFELGLYEPLHKPEISQQTAELLDELIDVLARALLEQDDD